VYFQVLSRSNDASGNPYRLFCVYDSDGNLVDMAEARSSTPNYTRELYRKGYRELLPLSLTPKEYRLVKSVCHHDVKDVD
jgi:hypothetical protein